MKKIETVQDLFEVLQQIPIEYRQRYVIAEGEPNGELGLMGHFLEDEDECIGVERITKEFNTCKSLKELSNYIDNIIKCAKNDGIELDSSECVTSEIKENPEEK